MLAEKGFRVVFLNTVGNASFWSPVGPKKQKRDVRDAHSAAKVLGAEKILLPYRHHEFTAGDFNAQREVVKIIQKVDPEIAIIHWPKDKWFGHRAAAINSFEALVQVNTFFEHDFKGNLKEIYVFEASNCQTFDFYPDFYIDISDRMDKLVESFSQFTAMGERIIKGLEKEKRAMSLYRATEGQWHNVKYAEAYKFLKY